MRKLVSTLMAFALVLVSTTACAERITPSKNYVTKKVNVGSFNGISTSSSVDVIYTQTSGSQSVEIYAPDNLVNYIDVRVEGGVLKVGFKSPKNNFSINGKHKKEVRVSAPAVNSLRASSSGDIIIKSGLKTNGKVTAKASSSGDVKGGSISCDDFVAGASSSGDVVLEKVSCTNFSASASSSGDVSIKNLAATNVSANASSSGDVILAGTCENATFGASSSGDVKAKGLKAVNVTASASSSGDVECYVTGALKAKASSSGEVAYKGNPKSVDFAPKRGLRKID
jgi:hypothetical protein